MSEPMSAKDTMGLLRAATMGRGTVHHTGIFDHIFRDMTGNIPESSRSAVVLVIK
jgi:hypothetical protein